MLQLTLFHYMSSISTADSPVLVPVLLHNHIVTSDPPLHVFQVRAADPPVLVPVLLHNP
jgi:hypothetical protein